MLTTLVLLLPAKSPWLGATLAADALTLVLYNAAVAGWLAAALAAISRPNLITQKRTASRQTWMPH